MLYPVLRKPLQLHSTRRRPKPLSLNVGVSFRSARRGLRRPRHAVTPRNLAQVRIDQLFPRRKERELGEDTRGHRCGGRGRGLEGEGELAAVLYDERGRDASSTGRPPGLEAIVKPASILEA